MIKIWVKLPHQGALYVLSMLLGETGATVSLEVQEEFYRINNVPTERTHVFGLHQFVPMSSFKHPVWWYLGGAFVIENLIELRNRDVIWKAESYDRNNPS